MKWKITLSLLLLSLFSNSQEINLKVAATDYLTASTYTFANTVTGAHSAATTFTIQNTLAASTLNLVGPPVVDLDGPDAAMFTVNEVSTSTILNNVSSTTFTITFSPTSAGLKTARFTIQSNDADEGNYVVNLSATATVTASSTIILTPSYAYPQNIAYQNYQATNITNTGNDLEIASFTLRDGSGTNDADNLPTTLTDISFTLTNPANIRSIALYDGITEIGADESGTSTVTFNGLNLTAPDNGSKVFTVRVSYNDEVIDKQQNLLTVSAATALSTGSVFAAANAGGVATPTGTGNINNRIQVVATKLAFVQDTNTVDTFVVMSPAVTVEAVDAFGNRDLDYVAAVILATTGTYSTSPAPAPQNDANNNAVLGLASFPSLVHGLAGTGLTLTATSGALTSVVSNPFDIGAASAANNYFRSLTSGDWNNPSSWQSSGDNVNWTTATIKPTAVSRGIKILTGHTITCRTTENGDQMTVDAGGTFVLDNAANFTLSNGTGNDLTVNGTFTYNNGTFTQSASTVTSIGATGVYNHAIVAATLTLPVATWGNGSTCNITGLNNATDIVATNMNQSFSNLNWNNQNQVGRVSINSSTFKVTRILNIGNISTNANNILCLASDGGTYTNTLTTTNIASGKLIASIGSGNSTVSLAGVTTITGGDFIASQGSASVTLSAANTFTVSGGTFTLINSSTSGNVNFTLTPTNRDFTLSGTGALFLEKVSSAGGVATLTLNRSFISSSTATPAVDFGTGIVTDNAINIKTNLTKTNNGTFTTTSTNAAKGFVFFNAGAQALSYAGTDSSSVSYTVNSGSLLTMSTNLTLGSATGAESIFTVLNGGRLILGTRSIIGNATQARVNIENGATLTSAHTDGLGGTGALGSFQGFGSVDVTPATGRVSLPAGINYILSGITTTPFPVGAGMTFGSPATITTSANITSNMTSALMVTSAFTVSTGTTFKLNTTNNNLILNNAILTITGNFDNNGENQILSGGGSPSILVNGKFLTRDTQGFVGTNTAIPTIVPTLGATSTVEYGLTGNQTVQGSPAYKNLTLSGSGTKTLDSDTGVSTKITVTSPAIFDVQAFAAGGAGTALAVTGTGQYKTSGTGVKPDATGTYTLAAGSFMEFYGSQPIEIRLGSPAIAYGKIVVNGTDVSTNSTTTGILFASTGAGFTVKNGAVFKFKNTDGFTGSTTTALSNSPLITPVLETTSTIQYAGASQSITPLATTVGATNSYKKMIISGTGIKTIPGTGEIFIADDLTITSSTLQIDGNRLLTVNKGINNSGGVIDIQNNGNLVQLTDGITNVGDIKMTRDTRIMKPFDHTICSSPVQQNVASQIPSVFTGRHVWNLTGAIEGSWSFLNTTIPGRGFTCRKNGTPAAAYSIVYTGTPNNGIVSVFADSYNATSDVGGNYILLGNPYPSAIEASKLVLANTTLFSGTFYFWTSFTPSVNNTYNNNDYATWNYSGGVGTKASTDISGTDNLKPTGFIAAGQGFFARIKADGNINFNNAMRSRTSANNGQYFRPGPSETDQGLVDHKIWLNLYNTTEFRQALVGYIGGATNEVEGMYDGDSFTDNAIDLYSIVGENKLVIQGRELPFVNTDVVPLGYRITTAGNYTIAIDELKGVFEEEQDIYLEDVLLNTTHNLKTSPYTFATETGVFDNRFVLKYINTTLGNEDLESISNGVMVFKNKGQLQIKSALQDIGSITVYDILGREVFEKDNINQHDFKADNVVMNTQTIIVKVKLKNGMVVTKKVIY